MTSLYTTCLATDVTLRPTYVWYEERGHCSSYCVRAVGGHDHECIVHREHYGHTVNPYCNMGAPLHVGLFCSGFVPKSALIRRIVSSNICRVYMQERSLQSMTRGGP